MGLSVDSCAHRRYHEAEWSGAKYEEEPGTIFEVSCKTSTAFILRALPSCVFDGAGTIKRVGREAVAQFSVCCGDDSIIFHSRYDLLGPELGRNFLYSGAGEFMLSKNGDQNDEDCPELPTFKFIDEGIVVCLLYTGRRWEKMSSPNAQPHGIVSGQKNRKNSVYLHPLSFLRVLPFLTSLHPYCLPSSFLLPLEHLCRRSLCSRTG